MEFVIDTSQFPLVMIRYPAQSSKENIAKYGQELDKVMKSGPLATVVDVRKVMVFSAGAEQRRFLAEQVDAATLANPGQLVAEAVVFNSKVLKGAYTAFNWIRKDKSYESRAFTDIESARSWSQAQLADAGLA